MDISASIKSHVLASFRETFSDPRYWMGSLGPCQTEWRGRSWRRSNAADEYDRYLQLVVSNLQRGGSDRAMVDYLVSIETKHMRLTDTASARPRAEATVAAIREQVEAIN